MDIKKQLTDAIHMSLFSVSNCAPDPDARTKEAV
jgi:hypothetical protein